MKKKQRKTPFFITFFILFLFWLVFSGKFDSFHLTLGLLSCFIVAYFTSVLLITTSETKRLPGVWIGFLQYFPWLIWQIVLANFHVLFLVLSPGMKKKINPQIIKFRSRIQDPVGLVTFANSITLTPGTITVALNVYGDMAIHAIDNESALPLPGEMEKRVAKIFGE